MTARPVPQKLRRAVYDRDQGQCARCGAALPYVAFHCHHRKMRSQSGKHEMANLVALDDLCHSFIHANPGLSYAEGWLVPSYAAPEEWPILRHGSRQLLTESGWESTVQEEIA